MSEIAEFTRHLGNYLPPPDVALVERAFEFSGLGAPRAVPQVGRALHHASAGGREHPVAVAARRAGPRRRAPARRDGGHLRHQERDRDVFGKPVADMVDGVSKLDQIEFNSREDAQAESFRKMLLAMAQRRPRHPDQARRPAAQHAHARRDGADAPQAHRARDARHLRADRQPPRPELAVPRAAGPVVQAL